MGLGGGLPVREFIDYTTSMTTYSDPLRGFLYC